MWLFSRYEITMCSCTSSDEGVIRGRVLEGVHEDVPSSLSCCNSSLNNKVTSLQSNDKSRSDLSCGCEGCNINLLSYIRNSMTSLCSLVDESSIRSMDEKLLLYVDSLTKDTEKASTIRIVSAIKTSLFLTRILPSLLQHIIRSRIFLVKKGSETLLNSQKYIHNTISQISSIPTNRI